MKPPIIKRWLLICLGLAAGFTAIVFGTRGLVFGYAEPPAEPRPRLITPPLAAAPSKPAQPERAKSVTWDELIERNSSSTTRVLTGLGWSQQLQTVAGPAAFQYEKGKLYELYLSIAQIGKDFILADSPVRTGIYAVVAFREGAMDSVSADKGDIAQIAGRFTGYRVVPMVSGASERYPVFELVGMNNKVKGSFHSFESAADQEAQAAWEEDPVRQREREAAARKQAEREEADRQSRERGIREEARKAQERAAEEARERTAREETIRMGREHNARNERAAQERVREYEAREDAAMERFLKRNRSAQ